MAEKLRAPEFEAQYLIPLKFLGLIRNTDLSQVIVVQLHCLLQSEDS